MERVTFPAKLENLEKMFDFIRAASQAQGFDAEQVNKIQLASEEALINVINYAYPDSEGSLEILSENRADSLFLKISDSGIAFDPLSLPDPDITAPIEKRKVGGLGVFLMRKIMDEVSYKREGGRNILTMVKYSRAKQTPADEAITKPGGVVAVGTQGECGSCFRWPLAFMKKEEFKKGDLIFKAGDEADRMFYIKKGAIRLVEINKVIHAGDVIGEMGVFSPFKIRTASASCEEDLEAYTMGRDEVIKFFSQDPALAIELIQLSIKRFIENLKAETAARERIESELRIAQEIQASMLPHDFPQRKEFEIFAIMDPAKEVGGDFYDFFFIDDKRLCFVIGDVSGKGVPAALFMAITKTLIKTEAKRGLSTDEVLARVNNILCPDNQTCLFVTVFCAVLDIETGLVQYCNAGHNPPLVITKAGSVDFVKVPCGFVVGVMENIKCERQELRLSACDTIFLYTDGVTEAMNPDRQQFSESRLRGCLLKFENKDIKAVINAMRQEVAAFARNEPQSDDITMLAIKYKGAVPC